MIRHYYGGVEIVAVAVVVQAVVEDGVSGFGGKWSSTAFAEGDEYCSSCFLIVREVAVVLVFSVQSLFGHGRQKQEQEQHQIQRPRTGVSEPHKHCSRLHFCL
jgi:hypothetical protein